MLAANPVYGHDRLYALVPVKVVGADLLAPLIDLLVDSENQTWVLAPLALAVPLIVAVVLLTAVAAVVVTVGNGCAKVVKDLTAPLVVPALLWATT